MPRTPLRLATDPGSTLCTTKQAYMCLFEVGSRPISPTPRRLSPSCAARGGIRATCGLQTRRGGEGAKKGRGGGGQGAKQSAVTHRRDRVRAVQLRGSGLGLFIGWEMRGKCVGKGCV